eukprot:9398838-Heterocapsa_arctica.AAC.1
MAFDDTTFRSLLAIGDPGSSSVYHLPAYRAFRKPYAAAASNFVHFVPTDLTDERFQDFRPSYATKDRSGTPTVPKFSQLVLQIRRLLDGREAAADGTRRRDHDISTIIFQADTREPDFSGLARETRLAWERTANSNAATAFIY